MTEEKNLFLEKDVEDLILEIEIIIITEEDLILEKEIIIIEEDLILEKIDITIKIDIIKVEEEMILGKIIEETDLDLDLNTTKQISSIKDPSAQHEQKETL